MQMQGYIYPAAQGHIFDELESGVWGDMLMMGQLMSGTVQSSYMVYSFVHQNWPCDAAYLNKQKMTILPKRPYKRAASFFIFIIVSVQVKLYLGLTVCTNQII